MYNCNQVHLIGNIGGALKTGTAANGTPYATFSVATNERWKDNENRPQTRTEWHTIVCWGKVAETAGKYLTRGSYVSVDGTLRSREYTPEDGVKRRVWEVRAARLGFLERVEQLEPRGDGDGESPPMPGEEEIPF